MKKALIEAWAKDLETTEAPQCESRLNRGDGFCCLGRLAIVAGYEFCKTGKDGACGLTERRIKGSGTTPGELSGLNERILREVGLTDKQQRRFWDYNDTDGLSFPAIAVFVRKLKPDDA